MRQVIRILGQEKRFKDDKPYVLTWVTVDDGTECEFYGDDISIGDMVEVFFHWNKIKCRHSKKPSKN